MIVDGRRKRIVPEVLTERERWLKVTARNKIQLPIVTFHWLSDDNNQISLKTIWRLVKMIKTTFTEFFKT